MSYLLDPIGYEGALPSPGRPQELVNKDVAECHVFVLLFWKRWGSPSGKFTSGTEEEFFRRRQQIPERKNPARADLFSRPAA
jgi:hypothetical protein